MGDGGSAPWRGSILRLGPRRLGYRASEGPFHGVEPGRVGARIPGWNAQNQAKWCLENNVNTLTNVTRIDSVCQDMKVYLYVQSSSARNLKELF